MPEIVNLTPFPNFRYYSSDNEGKDFGVVIVKGTFEKAPTGNIYIAEEQAPLNFSDKFYGEINQSSLRYPSDLVPLKPETDIIINAKARSLNKVPSSKIEFGFEITRNNDPIFKRGFYAYGERYWKPIWKVELSEQERKFWKDRIGDFSQWELSEPEKLVELPLWYEYAYGGLLVKGNDDAGEPIVDDFHFNPIGCGWIDKEWTDHTKPQRAPQIEFADAPLSNDRPDRKFKPASCGAIPCAWEPRLPLGGTYDDEWLENVWPNWPKDYSAAYHNSSNPLMRINGYLEGNEVVKLYGISHNHDSFDIKLRNDELNIAIFKGDEIVFQSKMLLDTLLIDFFEDTDFDDRIFITWRANFPVGDYDKLVIAYQPNREHMGA